jgi:hypothetical protein
MIINFSMFESIENWKPKYKIGDYVLVPANSWGHGLDFERDQAMVVVRIDMMDQEYALDFVNDVGKDPGLYGNIFDEEDIIKKLNKKEVESILEEERRPRGRIISPEDPYGEENWELDKPKPKKKKRDRCPYCNRVIQWSDKRCPECKTSLEEKKR